MSVFGLTERYWHRSASKPVRLEDPNKQGVFSHEEVFPHVLLVAIPKLLPEYAPAQDSPEEPP
jgi:hypothetical protein